MTIKKESIEELTTQEKDIMKIMMELDQLNMHNISLVHRQIKRNGTATERETNNILKTLCALNRISTYKDKFMILKPLASEEMK